MVKALWRMSRPAILPSGALAYAVGLAMAYAERGALAWPAAGLGLAITMLANLAAHYADEYADRDTDALSQPTLVSGGSGEIAAGLATPGLALGAALVVAAVTIGLIGWGLLGAALSPAAAGVAALGLLGGWVYSMPPLSLERRGLGEITNALLGGLLMPLMAYCCAGGARLGWACVALLPVLAAVFICVLGVHWPDRHADAAVGKYTLAVLFGAQTRLLHKGCVGLAYGLPLMLLGSILPLPVVLLSVATLPVGLWAAARYARSASPAPGAAAMASFMLLTIIGWLIQ
jgi:1,4-dihydroxy-2-naphthoate octaprenyltransferase